MIAPNDRGRSVFVLRRCGDEWIAVPSTEADELAPLHWAKDEGPISQEDIDAVLDQVCEWEKGLEPTEREPVPRAPHRIGRAISRRPHRIIRRVPWPLYPRPPPAQPCLPNNSFVR